MAIFPSLELEATVQINDKTRLNGSKSFISTGEAAITLVEIEPHTGSGFVNVTSSKYLDWQYSTAGTKTVTIRITTNGAPVSFSKTIEAVTAATDNLFSTDQDILPLEQDILKWVAPGRNSFLDKHRESQRRILEKLDEQRIHDVDGNALTKDAIVDIQEVSHWSKYLTLQIIFESVANAVGDIFSEKAEKYRKLAELAMNRSVLRLDLNGDAVVDRSEFQDNNSYRMVRR